MGKLTEELVEKIRGYYNEGNSCQKTSDKFGVGKTTVRSYVDIRVKKKKSDEEIRAARVEAVQRRRHKIKQMAIDYKGGCCQECGYNNYNGALEFHHLDPNEKDFSLGYKGHCTAWEKVKEELDKCVILCANCHREVHAGLIKL
jgi:5-methylcytosine-specific restriction endonuclease McrA